MKHSNEYQKSLDPRLFTECPKSVLAAIAVSFATSGGDWLQHASARIAYEWEVLYDNGIVCPSIHVKRIGAEERNRLIDELEGS